MRKALLALLLMMGISASAETEKVYFKVSDTTFNKDNWDGENNTAAPENNAFTIGKAFGSVAWNLGGQDMSDYARLVMKLKVQGNNVQFRIFDTDGGEYDHTPNLDHSDEWLTVTIDLTAGLTCTNEAALNLKSIGQLVFWNYWDCNVGDEGEAVTITIDEMYVETAGDAAPVAKRQLLLSEANKEWSADFLTIDIDNNTIVYDRGDEWGNAAVSWLAFTPTDISGFERLVLRLAEASTADIEIVISEDGFWGCGKGCTTILPAGQTRQTVTLAGQVRTDGGEPVDMTNVNLIFLRTGWTNRQTIHIDEFCLEKDDDTTTAISDVETGKRAAATTVYGLNGVQSRQLQRGLNIVRRADGTTVKVVRR